MSEPVSTEPPSSRVGLALAGGGPEGAVYEVGALRALEESIAGLDLNRLFMVVGVSAGAFVAANLCNRLTAAQMCRAIVKHEPGEHPFVPSTFLTPAFGDMARGGLALPGLALEALSAQLGASQERGLLEGAARLFRALPLGLFASEPVRQYLERIFAREGRTDDFRQLGATLRIVATDLDAGAAVCFGEPGWDHVPISRAVQASSALPILYAPVEIEGRHFVDGVLLKTLHASVALEAGAELVLCINPLVPVDTEGIVTDGLGPSGQLVRRGLPTVLSQTFRTLIHSRMQVGLAAYRDRYPRADVVLFEPERHDFLMFFTNVFSFAARKQIAAHAYRTTRRQLWQRRDELGPILARHGLELRLDELADSSRDLWTSVGLPDPKPPASTPLTARLDEALDRLQELFAGESPSPPR